MRDPLRQALIVSDRNPSSVVGIVFRLFGRDRRSTEFNSTVGPLKTTAEYAARDSTCEK